MTAHIYKPFDAELRQLKDQILAMGGLVEDHVSEAVRALGERDADRARRIIESDRAVNQFELTIDELCIRMLALRQPAASDLRFIAASLKMVTDLERIGDLAVNMAERAIAISEEDPLPVVVDIPRMAGAAQKMLRDSLDAFVGQDAARAEQVLEADDEIDDMMQRAFDDLLAEMKRDPSHTRACLATVFFGKHIERMADHTTNIAEMVIYQVRGQDIRHGRNR
jgi:phosphate transport system protein